jgi:hypothetical protein
MSDTPRTNESENPPESASADSDAPKRKGSRIIYGFSEETRRRLSGWTVVTVPRVFPRPTPVDDQEK